MFPVSWCCLALVIVMLSQYFFEELLGNQSCLWQPIHTFVDTYIHATFVVYLFIQMIMADGVIELWFLHVGVQVEILDIEGHEICSRG